MNEAQKLKDAAEDSVLELLKAKSVYIIELEKQVKEIDSELAEAQARISKQFIQMHEQQNELNMLRPIAEKESKSIAFWKGNYDRLKTELNDFMKEAAFMYNETREDGDPEMSHDEMWAYLMSRREEGGSVPHAMLRCDETPMQVHERLGQMGIMQSKKRDAESSAEFWARRKSQDEYAATVAQRRQA